MARKFTGKCAKCGNELIFKVFTKNDPVTPKKLRKAMDKEDFSEVYVYTGAADDAGHIEYVCGNCPGALLPNDREILEGWFWEVKQENNITQLLAAALQDALTKIELLQKKSGVEVDVVVLLDALEKAGVGDGTLSSVKNRACMS